MRLEGRITGFDEYMNIVLDKAEEVYVTLVLQSGRLSTSPTIVC